MVAKKGYLTELEGLRGVAALWVLLLHASHLSGTRIPPFSWGQMGVDVFILLSGFLMVHQFEQRKATAPWTSPAVIRDFWVRRYFRIAPLYYVLLFASMTVGAFLLRCNAFIASRSATAILDPNLSPITWTNALVHVSFAFGLIPAYHHSTWLPDWTLGLEMQFYFVFPLVMLLVRRVGYVKAGVCVLALSLVVGLLFPDYTRAFQFPSFLPLKMQLFLLGMLIAAVYHEEMPRIALLPFILLAPFTQLVIGGAGGTHSAAYVPGRFGGDILLASGLYAITNGRRWMQQLIAPVRWLLNARPIQKLGDISYSVYLVHMLVAPPVAVLLLKSGWVGELKGGMRLGAFAAAILLVVLPLSMGLYRLIELPGIALGKRVIGRLDTRRVVGHGA